MDAAAAGKYSQRIFSPVLCFLLLNPNRAISFFDTYLKHNVANLLLVLILTDCCAEGTICKKMLLRNDNFITYIYLLEPNKKAIRVSDTVLISDKSPFGGIKCWGKICYDAPLLMMG